MNKTTTHICGKTQAPCPARCNCWHPPCEDEVDDDMAASKGIFRLALICIAIWAVVIWIFT